MDVLHLPLGPVLSYWPPGLMVTLSLQGDVVTGAVVDRIPDWPSLQPAETSGSDAVPGAVTWGRAAAARRCDAVMSVLSLAGAGRLAGLARAARDHLWAPAVADATALATVGRLQRAARRARVLRWSLRGLAPVEAAGRWEGDVHARLQRMTETAVEETRTNRSERIDHTVAADVYELLPSLLTGLELATVRLAVASVFGFHGAVAAPARGAG